MFKVAVPHLLIVRWGGNKARFLCKTAVRILVMSAALLFFQVQLSVSVCRSRL